MRKYAVGFCVLVAATAALMVPVAERAASSDAISDADVSRLRAGEFVWHPEAAPAGPMIMIINLRTQRAYVDRNGVRIGASTISSGKPGHRTPTGAFTILEKERYHRSSKYDNAPMPYMQRLTSYGIALHGGRLPGYPASHGCIRLPHAFAAALFEETSLGMKVIIIDRPPAEAIISSRVNPKNGLESCEAG